MKFSRIARLAAATGLALGLVGLAAPAASAHAGTGWLRLAHLSPNTPAVDVYLYSFGDSSAMVVLKHVTYGTVSGYQKVTAGEYTVAMRGANASPSSKPVLSTTVNVVAGHAYTVAGMGPTAGLRLQVFKDRLTTPKGKALIRLIQASLVQHKVTVTTGSQTLASKLPFSDVTSYRTVSPGTLTVRAAGASESTSSNIVMAAGTIHTLVILDDPGHLTIDNLTDAAGSKVLPSGAPATGLGGTAPHPGAGLLPWLAIVSAGLLLTAASAIRRRQSRARAIRVR